MDKCVDCVVCMVELVLTQSLSATTEAQLPLMNITKVSRQLYCLYSEVTSHQNQSVVQEISESTETKPLLELDQALSFPA